MQLERLAKIGQSLLFSVALAGNIHIQALGNKPIALAPNGGRKWAFHIPILPRHEGFHPSISLQAGIVPCGKRV